MIWVFLGTCAFALVVLIVKGTLALVAFMEELAAAEFQPTNTDAAHWLKTNAEERDWLRSPKELL